MTNVPPRRPPPSLASAPLTPTADGRDELLALVAALREHEALLRDAEEIANVGSWSYDVASGTLTWSDELYRICGLEPGSVALTLEYSSSLIHPDDVARVTAMNALVVERGETTAYDHRIVRPDGTVRTVQCRSRVVPGASGAPMRVIGSVQDITDRIAAEEALRASETRVAQIAASVPGMVYQYAYRPDGSRGFTFVSDAVRTIFGIEPDALLRDAERLFALVHPDDRPGMHASGQAAVAAGTPWRWEGRAILAGGEERRVQVASHNVRQPDGTVLANGVLMDVTEMCRAAQQLEASEQHYRSLFDHNLDAVFSFDVEGRFVTANPACEGISGHPPEALIGTHFAPLLVAADLPIAVAHFTAALQGRAGRYEVAIHHRDGHQVQLGVTNVPIVVGGRVVGVFGIAEDLSVQRKLEAQLRQAQKMEAVGRLAGGVAHDFNNLLTVIQSFATFAAEEVAYDSPARSDLEQVHAATRRAAALTGQLLAFGRQQLLRPTRLDIGATVTGMATMLRRVIGEDIAIETELAPALWPVHADPGQLEQVVMNLVVNARDAMPGGGTLRLTTRNVVVDDAMARSRAGLATGRYVALVVEDSGVGIAAAVLPHVFEPFYTTKGQGKGTGLGLATVYGIVKQSGGFVYADSTTGQGSRFTVLLPGADGGGPDAIAEQRGAPAPRGSERVLLVEDEPGVRSAVKRMLERQGYAVSEAGTGAEALDVIAAAGQPFDLVLTDVVMPEMNGRALAERVRETHPAMRVVFMTGYTDDEILRRGLGGASATLLMKPFTVDGLASAVRAALDAA